jgi:uncharacterized membrane protein YoaK (UPF0700 family)
MIFSLVFRRRDHRRSSLHEPRLSLKVPGGHVEQPEQGKWRSITAHRQPCQSAGVSSSSGPAAATSSLAARPLSRGERAARSIRDPLARALLALTFTTGIIDAVSFIGLGRVFSANMTGNVVLLGFGIAGTPGLPVVAPIVSLAAFLAGAGAGGILTSRLASRHLVHVAATLATEFTLVGIAAILSVAVHVQAAAVSGDVVIALLALAMGARSATVRRLAVPDLNTTVLTQTLVGLASQSILFGGSGEGTTRRASAVVAMLTGAVAGALLVKASLTAALAAAALLALLTAAFYLPTARNELA